MNNLVILGLGSNKPWGSLNCYEILKQAITILGENLSEMKQASIYKSEPLLIMDQDPFLNTAVSGFFSRSPEELLAEIHQIEARFGRDRAKERRWGERSLDIDILLFGSQIVNSPVLQIPHPRLEERRFALEPLLELNPYAYSPLTNVSYFVILSRLQNQKVRRLKVK